MLHIIVKIRILHFRLRTPLIFLLVIQFFYEMYIIFTTRVTCYEYDWLSLIKNNLRGIRIALDSLLSPPPPLKWPPWKNQMNRFSFKPQSNNFKLSLKTALKSPLPKYRCVYTGSRLYENITEIRAIWKQFLNGIRWRCRACM